MNRHEPAGDEVELHGRRSSESNARTSFGGEHLQMRGIVLGLASGEEPQPVLQPVGVRAPSATNVPPGRRTRRASATRRPWIAQVLEQLARDHDVEGLAPRTAAARRGRPSASRFRASAPRRAPRLSASTPTTSFPSGVGPGQRAVAAAQVEHAPCRARRRSAGRARRARGLRRRSRRPARARLCSA